MAMIGVECRVAPRNTLARWWARLSWASWPRRAAIGRDPLPIPLRPACPPPSHHRSVRRASSMRRRSARFAVAMPFDPNPKVSAKALKVIDQNKFPRAALIEAAVRMVTRLSESAHGVDSRSRFSADAQVGSCVVQNGTNKRTQFGSIRVGLGGVCQQGVR